jgi:hypothetical protein
VSGPVSGPVSGLVLPSAAEIEASVTEAPQGRYPWPRGSATGLGSLPGDDIAEAQRTVLGELPDLPHLAELPGRGPGADLIGRSAALLVELPVELYAARWRVAGRPGRDLRVARDWLERDLDTLTELAGGYTGVMKIQVAGPWTLAAAIDLPIGGLVLRDPGATRDLAASLAEGVRAHVAEVRARLPHASILLQVDEPSLPAVLAGRVPTESGLGMLRTVAASDAREVLAGLVTAADAPVVVHCCAAGVPLALLRATGAAAVALDLSLIDALDPLGELIDAGTGLIAGTAPAKAAVMADTVRAVWNKLGFPPGQLADQVVVSPTCGLAGRRADEVQAVLAAYREAGRRLAE